MPALESTFQQNVVRPADEHSSYSSLLLAASTLVCGSLFFLHPELIARRPHGSFATELPEMWAVVRFYVLLFSSGTIAWFLQPWAATVHASARRRLTGRLRTITILLVLSCSCFGLALFILHFGRWQFGGWDFNILIETAWRQQLGQRPYLDFVAPTPPLFNWTAALAFRLFGTRWDANLYLSALFSIGTFLWIYALLRALGMHFLASWSTSLVVQIAAMLTCCFWWYNNTVLVLATLFYLSTLLLARRSSSLLGQATFVLCLALLALSKPNIAGVTIAGCCTLLFMATRRRLHAFALVVAGMLLAAALFFALHVPVDAMLATYRGIAKERGGLSIFGFRELSVGERRMTVLWLLALCLPLFSVRHLVRRHLASFAWQQAAFWCLFPFAALITLYGLMSNGEFRDVEVPPLLCAIALLAFVYTPTQPRLQRLTVTLMLAMAVADLYEGAARLRVYTMGKETFFAWSDNRHPIENGFLKHLRASSDFIAVDQQVKAAVQQNRGPLFFGPRLEFEYANQNVTSPAHWASFFQPGTAFGNSQMPELLQAWDASHFGTLIFLKGDYTFYPESFLSTIVRDYERDDRLARLTIYRRRSGR